MRKYGGIPFNIDADLGDDDPAAFVAYVPFANVIAFGQWLDDLGTFGIGLNQGITLLC